MIIVSVTGPTTCDAIRQIRESRRWADLFELRLDLIRDRELPRLLRSTRKPKIATIRPRWEGGQYDGSEDARISILKETAAAGVEYVDVELRAGRAVVDEMRQVSRSVRIIVSHHADAVPRSAREAYDRYSSSGGDIIKWAYPATDSPDLRFSFDFLHLARQNKKKAIVIAMDEPGEASRVLYRIFGGWATYASPESGDAAAPGQVSGALLRKLYRASSLNARTRVFGLLGNPVAHSKGVYLHNEAFRNHGVNAVYVRFPTNDLDRFLKDIMPLIEGCSVTLPFKELVAMSVRRKDPEVRATGAANTLYRVGRELRAANGDAAAALDAIEHKAKVSGKTMLIIGAGGVARAIGFEAKRRGAKVIITNRTAERASVTARYLKIQAVPFSEADKVEYDFLANATPAGMFPLVDESPVPREFLRPGTVVFDAIANPPITRLLREAEEAGAFAISGAEMFVRQAARQQELFLHKKANLGTLRRTMNKYVFVKNV